MVDDPAGAGGLDDPPRLGAPSGDHRTTVGQVLVELDRHRDVPVLGGGHRQHPDMGARVYGLQLSGRPVKSPDGALPQSRVPTTGLAPLGLMGHQIERNAVDPLQGRGDDGQVVVPAEPAHVDQSQSVLLGRQRQDAPGVATRRKRRERVRLREPDQRGHGSRGEEEVHPVAPVPGQVRALKQVRGDPVGPRRPQPGHAPVRIAVEDADGHAVPARQAHDRVVQQRCDARAQARRQGVGLSRVLAVQEIGAAPGCEQFLETTQTGPALSHGAADVHDLVADLLEGTAHPQRAEP